MKATEARALLADHAVEQLGPSDEGVVHARAANPHTVGSAVRGMAEQAAALAERFTPGPPRPAPPPQSLTATEARIVLRSISGDDEDATPRLPSLRGFLAAAAASGDWGVPIKSGAKWMGEKEGPSFATSSPRHDPCTGREHYALAQRELGRIADALPAMYGLDGAEQMSVWGVCAGAGRIELRNIHAGGGPDAIDREEKRRAAKGKKRKGKAAPMQPPQKRRAVLVPERKTMTATEVAAWLRDLEVYITPHQVGLVCRHVTASVREAFEKRGWIRTQTKAERDGAKPKAEADAPEQTLVRLKARGTQMATLTGHDLQGWKSILNIIGCSANTARALMARKERRLPVTLYLGTPNAKAADLRRWQDEEIAAALAEPCAV